MSLEAFLINRPKKSKRKVSRRKKRSGGLPRGLLSKMIRTYGIKRGMKEAWKSVKGGSTKSSRRKRKKNPWEQVTYPRHKAKLWRTKRTGRWGKKTGHKNPFGEEVLIVGANPKRRKRSKRRRVRRNVANAPRRKLYASSRRRHKRVRRNPARSYRRHYRRNLPARSGAFSLSASKPMSLIMPIAVGAGGYFVSDYVPALIGMSTSPMMRIGVKAGIAFGGGMVLSKFLGAKNGVAFALGAGINAVNDVLRTYIFKTTTATTGIGAFAPAMRTSGLGAMSPYGSSVRSPYAS